VVRKRGGFLGPTFYLEMIILPRQAGQAQENSQNEWRFLTCLGGVAGTTADGGTTAAAAATAAPLWKAIEAGESARDAGFLQPRAHLAALRAVFRSWRRAQPAVADGVFTIPGGTITGIALVFFPVLIFSTNATLSVLDDGCSVNLEGDVVCAGPFPFFKIVAMVSIVGTGVAVEGVTTLCLRRKDAQMQRRVSVHALGGEQAGAVRPSGEETGGRQADLTARLLG
jgi:hypothetical protein